MTNTPDFNNRDQTAKTPSLADVIGNSITARLLDSYIALPGNIESYKDGKAEVQINLKKKIKGENGIINSDIPKLVDVPVCLPRSSGGKAFVQLPLKKGDTGFLIFSQRSLDDWLVTGGNVQVKSTRMNSLSDAVFYPGLYPFDDPVPVANNDNLFINNDKMSIELFPDGKLKISGSTSDFLSLMNDTLQGLINAKVITGIGPQPFLATTILEFQAIKTKLEEMIP